MSDGAVSRTFSSAEGRSLLVTRDAIILGQLKLGLQKFAISVDVCPDAVTAASLINTRKFEAIIVDLTLGEPGWEFHNECAFPLRTKIRSPLLL
jgi:hypothetical protein